MKHNERVSVNFVNLMRQKRYKNYKENDNKEYNKQKHPAVETEIERNRHAFKEYIIDCIKKFSPGVK